jgi:hypothetical protein
MGVTEENQVATELRSDRVPTEKTFFFSYSLPVVELLTWPRTKTKKVFFTPWVLVYPAAP